MEISRKVIRYSPDVTDRDKLEEGLALVRQVFDESTAPTCTEAGRQQFQAYIDVAAMSERLAQGALTLWLCCQDETVVGVIALRPPSHVSLLFVREGYRQQGIARTLFGALCQNTPEAADITVHAAQTAMPIYRKLGFRCQGPKQMEDGLCFIPMAYKKAMPDLQIGCHLSAAKGYLAAGKQAYAIGANSFQFFTRNPRGGKAKALDPLDIAAFLSFGEQAGIYRVLAHAPYTLNACSVTERVREFTQEIMADDLDRLSLLPQAMYNFHPGSCGGQTEESGIRLIAQALNNVLRPEQETLILLETMAGKGSEIGGSFTHIREIIGQVKEQQRLGVCLDTCHVFDAGYDIVAHLEEVLAEFDKIVGLGRLKAVHLNDSMNALGSRKDRHARLGEGKIGLAGVEQVINHPALRHLPFYLETPNEVDGYAREIALVKKMRRGTMGGTGDTMPAQ